MAQSDELTFAPLGGVGEIGMNLSIYGFGNRRHRSWLAIDLGVSFGDEEHLPGIDTIMPDISFLVKERKNLVGLVLTHAHEDHFGAIIDLWPRLKCPIYATKFSAALFEAKCAAERNPPKIPVTVVPSGSRIELGPFGVEFIPVAHSIPESHALAIHTAVGTALHTGDWKLDPTPVVGLPTDERRLRELGDAGVMALIGDSTNAVRDGRSPSETEVAKTITELVKAARGRVAVTTFASNVARLRAVADAARLSGREVVVVGRAMERVVQVARETGYLDGVQNFRSAELYGHFPPDKVLALCTGSQGEPRAALARIANDDHPQVTLNKGDCGIDHQRPDRAGDRGHYRSNPSRACVGPSAPRRIARHDRLGPPATADSRAWRSIASVRACQTGAGCRCPEGADLPQRRSRQAGTGRGRHHRGTAFGPALQGWQHSGGFQVSGGRGAAAAWVCRLRLCGAGDG
jgi:ribonuclease J